MCLDKLCQHLFATLNKTVIVTNDLLKVPTDVGMCCAFNRHEADKIFVEAAYTEALREFNKDDIKYSFDQVNNSSGKFFNHSILEKTI